MSKKTAKVFYRDLWGLAKGKRQSLLDCSAGEYEPFEPTKNRRWKLMPYESMGGYEDWPSLEELFTNGYQGVNPNRGIDGSLIDTDRDALTERMTEYFSSLPWESFRAKYPELARDRARYKASKVREKLYVVGVSRASASGQPFANDQIASYVLFPLDDRHIFYETEEKLLNERRPELWENLTANLFLIAVPEPRQVSESRPLIASSLFDLHLMDRGAVGFPLMSKSKGHTGDLFNETEPEKCRANLSEHAWKVLRDHGALLGEVDGEDCVTLVRKLFFLVLALGHSPRFESDHGESLAQDWLHLPIPRDPALLEELAAAGDKVAALLNPLVDAREVLQDLLGSWYSKLAVVSRTAAATGPADYTVTYSYFGGGKGRWESKLAKDADWPPSWGDQTGDLYLNPTCYLANVPEKIWRYELGGYPVIKKWLGYRDAKRRAGGPLTQDELAHLRSIVQRLAALHILHSQLDALYERVGSDVFTAEELGLRTS